MEKIIDFICENYELLILLAACLLDLILFLCGVFKKKKSDDPLAVVISKLPDFIVSAEKRFKIGSEKKEFVLFCAKSWFKRLTGIELSDSSAYMEEISSRIERILETPTKKGLKE